MRHRWTWQGFSGAPGYTSLYGLGTAAQAFADGIKAFLQLGIANGGTGPLPTPVSITPDPYVDIIRDSDGGLSESQAITAPAVVQGAGGSAFGSPMGVSITWQTAGIEVGAGGRPRRVRGRTFLVPLNGTAFDVQGTFNDTALAALRTACNTYVAGSWNPCVWHRPTTVGGTNGASHRITAASVKDRAAVLTSRRA